MRKKTKRIVAVLLAFAIILQQDGLAGMTIDGSALADEILQEEALEPEIIEDTPADIAEESQADAAAEGQADSGTDAAMENSANSGMDGSMEEAADLGTGDPMESSMNSVTNDSMEEAADPGAGGSMNEATDPGTDAAAENPEKPQITVTEIVQVDSAEEALPEGEASLSEEQSSLSEEEPSLPGEESVFPALRLDNSVQIAAGAQVSPIALKLSRPDGFPENATWKMETLKMEEMAGLTAGTAMSQAEGLALRFSVDLNGSACDLSGTTAVLDGLDISYLTGAHLSLYRDAAGESESNESVESGEYDESGDPAGDSGVSAAFDMSGANKWEELAVQFSQNGGSVRASFSVDSDGVLFFWKDVEADTEEADGESMEAGNETESETTAEAEQETEIKTKSETETDIELETEAETDIEQGSELEAAETALGLESVENESETELESETKTGSETEAETEAETDELAYNLANLSSDGLMQIDADGTDETTYPVYEILYDDGEMVFQTNDTPDGGRKVTQIFHDDGNVPYDINLDDWSWDPGNTNNTAKINYRSMIKKVTFKDDVPLRSLQRIFSGCTELVQVNINGFKADDATSLARAFEGCTGLTSLDLRTWSTSKVTNMGYMFLGCTGLTDLNVSTWDTSNVSNLFHTFQQCSSLKTLDLSSWTINDFSRMNIMNTFEGCNSLTALDLSGWSMADNAQMSRLFFGCTSLSRLKLGSGFRFIGQNSALEGTWVKEGDDTKTYSGDELMKQYTADNAAEMAGVYRRKVPISFYSNYGTDNVSGKIEKYIGTALGSDEVADPTRAGYTFDGWWTERKAGEGEKLEVGREITQTSYYAHWTENTVYEIFYKNTGELVFQNTKDVKPEKGEYVIYEDAGNGALSDNVNNDKWDFYAVRDQVISVKFNDNVKLKTLRSIFKNFTHLTNVDTGPFDASGIDMLAHAFEGCTGLTSLDLENWDTSKATNMGYIFNGCTGLTDLKVSTWDTSLVTNLYQTFQNCSSLPTLDVSQWKTSNVNNMMQTFQGCKALTELNLSSWSTQSSDASHMSNLLSGCTVLSRLTIGADFIFKTATNVASAGLTGSWMNESTNKVYTADQLMKNEAGAGTYVRPSVYEILYSNGELVFQDDNSVDTDKGNVLAIYSDIGSNAGADGAHGWAFYENRELITMVTFKDNVKLTSLRGIFFDYPNLTTVNLDEYDAAGVTDVSSVFRNCPKLETLDLSGWKLSSATTTSNMFEGCSKLKSIEGIEDWDVSNVGNNMNEMFKGCQALTSLDLSGWNTQKVTGMWNMFAGCGSLNELTLGADFRFRTKNTALNGSWQRQNTNEIYTATELMNLDESQIAGTYVRVKVYEILYESGELVFQNDNQPEESKGRVVEIYEDDGRTADSDNWAFHENRDRIRSVTFRDNVHLQSLQSIFRNCTNLTKVDTGKFTAEKVTHMGWAFSGCTSLASLNLSGWDTSSVTYLGRIFQNCGNLRFLNISGWNTVKVTNLFETFQNCSSLTSLNVNGWDTANVDNMISTFQGCSSLTELDLSRWNTGKVTTDTNMQYLFSGCTALSRLILGSAFKFQTSATKNAGLTGYWQKEGTDELYTSEQLMNNEANVPGIYIRPRVFEILYESGEMVIQSDDTPDESKGAVYEIYEDDGSNAIANVNDWAFQDVKNLITSVTFRDNVKLRSMYGMFYGCANLTAVDTGGFDAATVTSMGSAFRGCRSLTALDLSGWDTSNVTNMSNMFQDCKSLVSIDGIGGWDTSKVSNVNEMFRECNSLLSLDLNNWNTAKAQDKWNMFYNSGSLLKLTLGAGFVKNDRKAQTSLLDGWMKKTGENDYVGNETTGAPFTGEELTNQDVDHIAGTYYRSIRISFNGCGGAVDPQGIDGYLDMEIEKLPTAKREGYDFLGWFTERVGGEPLVAGGKATALTYYAHWNPFGYTLRIYPQTGNPGDEIKEETLTFSQFYQLSENFYTNEGKFLVGWNTKSNGMGKMYEPNARVFGLADQNGSTVNLYAVWGDPDDYVTLTFDTQGGSAISPMLFKKGEKTQYLPQPTREGFRFDCWSYGADGSSRLSESSYVEMTEDTTLYAQWLEYLTATFDPCAEDELSETTVQTTVRDPLPFLPKLPQRADGRTLMGWFTAEREGEQIKAGETRLKEDTTFYAHWGWRPQFDTAGGNFEEYPEIEYQEDSSIYKLGELPEVTRDGYKFEGWYWNDKKVEAGEELDLSQGTHIVARWTEIPQAVVTLDPEGGTVNGKEDDVILKTYLGMTLGDLPIPERDGYVFQGWYNGTELCSRNTPINGNTRLTAKWVEAVYVTFKDGNTIEKRISVAKGGTIPSLPGLKKQDYILDGWYT